MFLIILDAHFDSMSIKINNGTHYQLNYVTSWKKDIKS